MRHLNRPAFLLICACTGARPALYASAQQAGSVAADPEHPTRFEADIRAFEAQDRKSPPPTQGIVFVGSSSIKNWTAPRLEKVPELYLDDSLHMTRAGYLLWRKQLAPVIY